MLFRKPKAINLFDKYTVTIPSNLKYHMDRHRDNRVLFISDCFDSFVVSFEEGMQNMISDDAEQDSKNFFEYSENGKHIKVQRVIPKNLKNGGYAFFSIEMDDNGKKTELNGQMTAHGGYKWSDNIEPILIKLLDCISI